MERILVFCSIIFLRGVTTQYSANYSEILNINVLIVTSMNSEEIFSLYFLRPIIDMAVRDAYDLHGVRFGNATGHIAYAGASFNDSCDLVQSSALIGSFSLVSLRTKPHIVVGPFCDADMRVVAQLAMGNNFTVFTAGTPYWDIFNTENGLHRIAYSAKDLLQPIIKFCLQKGWTNLTVIWYQTDFVTKMDARNYTYELQLRALDSVVTGKSKNSSISKIRLEEIVHNVADPRSTNATDNLVRASLKSRMFIFLLPPQLLRIYLIKATQLGFTNGNYVFFILDEFVDNIVFNKNRSKGSDGMDDLVQQAFQNVFVASIHNYQFDMNHRNFVERMINATDEAGVINFTSREAIFQMANHFDALMIIARAFRVAHQRGYGPGDAGVMDVFSSVYLNKTLQHDEYGLSCDILSISAAGDKKEKYDLWYMNRTSRKYVIVAIYDSLKRKFNQTMDIWWPNDTVPVGYPPCGYTGTECAKSRTVGYVVSVALLCAFLFFVASY